MTRISVHLKIVVTFRKPGTNAAQIRNFVLNNIVPDMRTALQNRMAGDVTNVERSERLIVNNPSQHVYEVYPKMVAEFDTELSASELRDRRDLIISDFKNIIKTALDTQNASQYSWHYHLSGGSVNE